VKHVTGKVDKSHLLGNGTRRQVPLHCDLPVSTSSMLDSRFLGRVYLIPVSVKSLTHLTLSNRLIGAHLVFLLFILPPARSRLPPLQMEHMTIITSLLQRRTSELLPYIRSKLREPSDCRPPRFCTDPSTIIGQSPYPTASGGLGDVYRCTLKYDAGSVEVSHRLMFSPCAHSGFRSQSNPFGFHI
jgi:hypothetical protein